MAIMQTKPPMSLEELKAILFYDPIAGIFIWKRENKGMTARLFPIAISKNTGGYNQIKIDYRRYRGSKLAWFYMTGEWPLFLIDHENRNRGDDSFKNLRPATYSQNAGNKKVNKNSKTGIKGVSHSGRKFSAFCAKKYLGTFETKEEAARAYEIAAKARYGVFASSGENI